MNRCLPAALAAFLFSLTVPAKAQSDGAVWLPYPPARSAHDSAAAAIEHTITFQMDRLGSVREFWARYYGQPLPYRENGEEDLQDSIARCMLSFLSYKMKRLDTIILYAGRDPGDEQHLICHVFPLDEAAYTHMCGKIGMNFAGADETNYRLTCAQAQPPLIGMLPPR